MATQAAWMRAFSETDFSALTNGVPPATLDHESLLGLGLKKCSDRKAILRRYSKTCTHHHISSKIDCTAKVYAANAEGSPGATINDLQTITFFFFLSFLSFRTAAFAKPEGWKSRAEKASLSLSSRSDGSGSGGAATTMSTSFG